MRIDDQIRDEKLQYDINREAAKISALSSSKIDKYEYFTGEEILPSNQKQIIEQVKFTYSPLGKAFEKQIKSIEDQGEKQVKALKTLKPKELEAIEDRFNYKHNKIFYELSSKRIGDVYSISKEIDFNNLIYYFKSSNITPIDFIGFKRPLRIRHEIMNGDLTIEKIEEDQKQIKSKLNEISTGNPNYKSKNQTDKIKNIKNLYESRQKGIDLFNNSSKIRSKALYETKNETKNKTKNETNDETSGTGIKILTSKQILQRLAITLAQVKVGNNSESLLNEIRQIVYSLYQSK